MVNIIALERIATSQDEDRRAQISDIVDELPGFFRRQLLRAAPRLRTCAAVDTCQIACLSGFPNHDQWFLRQIKTGVHGTRIGCLELDACDACHTWREAEF